VPVLEDPGRGHVQPAAEERDRLDRAFIWEAGIFCVSLLIVLTAVTTLLKLRDEGPTACSHQ
jgi:hypothetical protein